MKVTLPFTCPRDGKTRMEVTLSDEDKEIDKLKWVVECSTCHYLAEVVIKKGKISEVSTTDTFMMRK